MGDKEILGDKIDSINRFDDDITHMIMIRIISDDCSIGAKGEHYRMFLNDIGFYKAIKDVADNNTLILEHATVSKGKLTYCDIDQHTLKERIVNGKSKEINQNKYHKQINKKGFDR